MNKLLREDIDKFFHYGIDVPSKTLFIGSGNFTDSSVEEDQGVNYIMAEKALKGIYILDKLNKNKKLTIIMNNIGGDEYHGLAIFDAIKKCKSQTVIKVFGSAMSMGAWILQAADKRLLAPNATVMVHYGEAQFNGHMKTFQKTAEESKRLDHLMEDALLERIREKHPRYTREQLQDLIKFDKYLSARDAVDLGLADRIL